MRPIFHGAFFKMCVLTVVSCLSALPLLAEPATSQKTKPTKPKPAVMVLGTYHMGNPNLDIANAQADDVSTPKRQKELEAFAKQLAAFKPTKIALEQPFGTDTMDKLYQQYLTGEFALKNNELYQVGFRLAKVCGHKTVYPIDAEGKFPWEEMQNYAQKNGQEAIINQGMAMIQTEVGKINDVIKTRTVSGIFKYLNDPEYIKQSHSLYLQLLRVGKGTEYPGATLVSEWYARNLRIMANLQRITDSPNDRILVIYGAGHSHLLRQFVLDSGEYSLVEPNTFLME